MNQHACKYDGNSMLIAVAMQSEQFPANVAGFSRTLKDTKLVASSLVLFFPDFLFAFVHFMFTQVTNGHLVSCCVMPSPPTLLMRQTEDGKIRKNLSVFEVLFSAVTQPKPSVCVCICVYYHVVSVATGYFRPH